MALLDDDVAEGSYTLSIQAAGSRFGNRSQLSHAFTLDRTARRVDRYAGPGRGVLS
ncbi:MAG: hypothetical protein IPK27_08325 [Rhodanobacteraceae bacterium]|nr:hypothetical protein [Rhodanobacteraceae bacterium]